MLNTMDDAHNFDYLRGGLSGGNDPEKTKATRPVEDKSEKTNPTEVYEMLLA